MSAKKKNGAKASKKHLSFDSERKGRSVPIVPSNVPVPEPSNNPILISIGPPHHRPSVSSESQYQGLSQEDDNTNSEGRRREAVHCYPSTSDGGVRKKTIQELQSKLHESFLQSARDEGRSYPPGRRVDCKPDQIPSKSFSTFKPLTEFSRRASRLREGHSSNWDSDGSSGTDGPPNRSFDVNSPTVEKSYWGEAGALHTGQFANIMNMLSINTFFIYLSVNNCIFPPDNKEHLQAHSFASQNFISDVDHIKQHISRENISFVRFEATDLHGVSRSKTVPARFFHVSALLLIFCNLLFPCSFLIDQHIVFVV